MTDIFKRTVELKHKKDSFYIPINILNIPFYRREF